jgi:F420-dependent oxidoreductase-like protein
MELGIQVPSFSYPGGDEAIGPVLEDVAKIVDDGNFKSLWVMDHYLQIPLSNPPFKNDPTEPMLEGYSALNFFAGITKRVMLGTLVTGSIYRNPGFLIKQVTTLDVLSNGRAYFGVGAGWFEKEAVAYGFPFDSWKTRFEKLEDILQLAHQMWSDNNGKFEGTQFTLEETICEPQPLADPHPPIMIGGMGEKKTLRYVAKYADACNLFMGAGPDVIKQKLDVLKNHCEKEGRPYDEIEKTFLGTVNTKEQSAQQIIEEISKYKDFGLDHLIVNMPNIYELEPLHLLNDEVVPAIEKF